MGGRRRLKGAGKEYQIIRRLSEDVSSYNASKS